MTTSVQTMQLCSMKQGTVSAWSIKPRLHDQSVTAVTDWSCRRGFTPRCFRLLQVFPTMSDSSDCETAKAGRCRENTGSCSQDVAEGGVWSNASRIKVASSGLNFTKLGANRSLRKIIHNFAKCDNIFFLIEEFASVHWGLQQEAIIFNILLALLRMFRIM